MKENLEDFSIRIEIIDSKNTKDIEFYIREVKEKIRENKTVFYENIEKEVVEYKDFLFFLLSQKSKERFYILFKEGLKVFSRKVSDKIYFYLITQLDLKREDKEILDIIREFKKEVKNKIFLRDWNGSFIRSCFKELNNIYSPVKYEVIIKDNKRIKRNKTREELKRNEIIKENIRYLFIKENLEISPENFHKILLRYIK